MTVQEVFETVNAAAAAHAGACGWWPSVHLAAAVPEQLEKQSLVPVPGLGKYCLYEDESSIHI